MTNPDKWYVGREQTLVKHYLLKDYLAALANIVGQKYDSITYVDCFSGPWKAASEQYEDTSFGIAVSELRKAREQLKSQFARNVEMRCFFIEKSPGAYQELKSFLDRIRQPGFDLQPKNGRFEELIPEIRAFALNRARTFSFFFIDPKGWKPVAIRTLRPLLKLEHSEVLINLMTSHLRRFEKTQNLSSLFDSEAYADKLLGLKGQDLDDEMVGIYSDQLKRVGGYDYVCAAIILRASIDTPHYRLIYGSRNPLGLAKFKDAEKRAMKKMEPARAEAKLRKLEERTSQAELFAGRETYGSRFYFELRTRYLVRSERRVMKLLSSHKPLSYDILWKTALTEPLVFESDLREWLVSEQRIRVLNLGTERVPKFGKGHTVVMES